MTIEPKKPEANFYPLDETVESSFTEEPNTPASSADESNIIPTGGGTVLKSGTLQSPNFSKGNAGWQINSNGNIETNAGTFRGALVANSIDIPDTTTANSFHVNNTGDAWWGATTLAAAVASITKAGVATFTNVTITGGSIGGTATVGIANLNIANRGWSQTSAFSVTDADTVAWGAGTFTTADGGTAYSIGAGNTGNMSAKTYIYLDTAVSTTAYQTTTTAATAVGAGKVLIAIAQNATGEATYQVMDGQGGQNIDAANIVANSITANELSTSITYAGAIVIDTSGNIRSGQTAYNTGTGWFIGNDSGTAKLSMGDGTVNNSLTWDGTNLTVNGSVLSSQDVFGDGSDGDVVISADTTLSSDMFYDDLTVNSTKTLNTGGYRIFVKGTLTNNGTIRRNGNNGTDGTNGTGTNGSGIGAAGTGGAALADGSIKGAIAGVDGVAGRAGVIELNGGTENGNTGTSGSNGVSVAKSLVSADGVSGSQGSTGGNGTAGGTGTGGSGGSVGTGGSRTGTIFNKIRSALSAYLLYDFFPAADNLRTAPSNGSGSSGGSAGCAATVSTPTASASGDTGGVGGGGGQGGIVWIAARRIINAGTISANGGNGGNSGNSANSTANNSGGGSAAAGGSGGSAGGTAGNGGVLIYVYSSLTNSGTIQAVAGTPGNGGTHGTGATAGGSASYTDGSDGATGASGNAGVVISIVI